jgi:hypothetical protein
MVTFYSDMIACMNNIKFKFSFTQDALLSSIHTNVMQQVMRTVEISPRRMRRRCLVHFSEGP